MMTLFVLGTSADNAIESVRSEFGWIFKEAAQAQLEMIKAETKEEEYKVYEVTINVKE